MDGLMDTMLTKIWNKSIQQSSQAKQNRIQEKATFKNRFFNTNNDNQKRIIKAIFKSPFHYNSLFSQTVATIFADPEGTFEVKKEQPSLLLEEDAEK